MFTRYSNIDIPQNYSGSRFNKQVIEDTETKIHSTPIQGATKSSVSPTFEYNKAIIAEEEKIDEVSVPVEDDISSIEENANNDNKDNSLSVLSQFTDYFKRINSDDLLLIALIIFLLNDHNMNNNDIIIILSLMLIYHQ